MRENKEKRKEHDYGTMPLTLQGELMMALIRSGVSSYPHTAVAMQFFEVVARYGDFFRVRKECIVPVLTAFIDERWADILYPVLLGADHCPSVAAYTIQRQSSAVASSTFSIVSSRTSKGKFHMNMFPVCSTAFAICYELKFKFLKRNLTSRMF